MPKMLFVGGKFNSIVASGVTRDSTQANTFDAAYTDSSLLCELDGDQWHQDFTDETGAASSIGPGQTGYAHTAIYAINNATATANRWELRDASNFPWIALRNASSGISGIYGNTGTGAAPVWTLIGATFAFLSANLLNCDIKFTHSAPNIAVEFSINGSLAASGTFTQASLPAITRIAGKGITSGSSYQYFSQIMASEGISTINGKVRYRAATGAGASSGWTGAFGDINEAVNNDAAVLSSGTAGQRSTFAMGDVAVPVGFVIRSAFIWSRAKNDGVAPQNIKGVVRSSGTDYPMAANFGGLGTSFKSNLDRRDNDPATALPWTQAGWNAVEAGFDSVT